MGGVDDRRVEHLAGVVHDRHLTSCAVAGVEPQHRLALDGRLHEQLFEVGRKDLHRVLARGFGQLGADLALEGREDQPRVSVLARGTQDVGAQGVCALVEGEIDDIQRKTRFEHDPDLQEALFLTAVDGEDAVTRDLLERLRIVIVVGIDTVLLLVRRGRFEQGVFAEDGAQVGADRRAVGQHLGNDIHCAAQCVLSGEHFLFLINKILCGFHRVKALFLLDDRERERFESALLGDRGSGLSLGLIGAVDVLKLAEGLRLVEGGADFVGQLFLTVDQLADLFSALVEVAQVFQLLAECADELVVHGAVHLLTVTGDEGDGIALIEQGDDVLRVLLFDIELL